ncbi:hypothetical protein Halar_3067 [halophilic archaeon DL31]|nr:hypothetical protein Halar_3067 [halophilic archaeon DL31]
MIAVAVVDAAFLTPDEYDDREELVQRSATLKLAIASF